MIELRHLRKEYEDITPFEDINLTINNGDVISLIGPSGTGKSTLLRCINMLEEPTSGEIIVDGQIINDGKCDLNEVRKKMGMVFQSFNLFGHLTVIENIMNPQITLLGRSKQEAYEKAMDLLYTVGLATKVYNYPSDLSGGQQQRIAIARTLAMDPEIILFDEPTSALDPSMIGEVQSVIRLLAKTGVTMMIVTHEMDFARKIANRVIYMDEGGIYEEGTPKQIFENPQREKTRKFIHRLSSIDFKINNEEFDTYGAISKINDYGDRLLIEPERMLNLTTCFEEICINNLMQMTEEPNIEVSIEYSEKKDLLNMTIVYEGDHFDLSTSQNEAFKQVLNAPDTKYTDRVITDESDLVQNFITMTFIWEEM